MNGQEKNVRNKLMEALDLMGYSKRLVIGTVSLLRTEEMAREMLIYLRDHREATEQEVVDKTAEITRMF